jgi:hypothetical protein
MTNLEAAGPAVAAAPARYPQLPTQGSPATPETHEADTAALAVLAGHLDDGSGMCRECLEEFGQLKPAPCEQARWAARIAGSERKRAVS